LGCAARALARWDLGGTLAVRDLAANGPGATGEAKDAQNTMSAMVALKRFILVDRFGFAILPRPNSQDSPLAGAPRRYSITIGHPFEQCLKKSGGSVVGFTFSPI